VGLIKMGSVAALEVELFTDKQPVDWVWVVPFTPIAAPEDDMPVEPDATPSEGAPDKDETP
jgi:hypothetical protein